MRSRSSPGSSVSIRRASGFRVRSTRRASSSAVLAGCSRRPTSNAESPWSTRRATPLPRAQYQIGHALALQGEITAAMEEFQTVRNRYPQSDWAARAIERITALYRFRGGRPSFRIDASFSLSGGDVLRDVRAILLAPDGALWLASNKTNSAVPFTAGRAGPSVTGKNLASLSLTPDGELVVTAKLAVRIGRRNIHSFTIPGQKPRPLEQLTSALVLPGGDVLVADKKRKGIFRFDSDYNYIGPFPDNREREITRLVRDEEGGIVCLDAKAKTIRIYDATGRPLRSIAARGSGYELKRPVDIAVDAALNIYVVDSQAGVFVIGRQGQLLATLGAGQLREPVALTLEPGGSVLVYDKKARQVFRFH